MSKTEIQGKISLLVSKRVEDVQDAVAKFDESNIQTVEVLVTLLDGSIHKMKIDDYFVQWINEYRDGEESPL